MKRVVVISGTNHYEERAKSVIEEYQKEHEVIYLTSDFNHWTKEYFKLDLPYAQQLHVIGYYKNLSPSRILSHIQFSIKTFFRLMKLKPDIVYAEIPHNTLAVATKWYKRFHKCEVVLDIFDMWPEALPIKSENPVFKIACAVWRSFRNRNLKYADKVYTECGYYQEIIRKEGCDVPMETKYLTRKKVDLDIQTVWDAEKIHLCYVGNINNIIDIPCITEFLAKIHEKKPVCLHLIGNGESRGRLIESIENRGVQVVSYGVIYDVHRLQEVFNQCYFGINFLLPNLAIGLTMKSITYLRGGIPLLNTVDGDTWNMVDTYHAGINIEREDMDKAVDMIINMDHGQVRAMKENAHVVFEEHFAEE